MKNLLIPVFILFISFSTFAQDRFDLFYLSGNYNINENDIENYEASIMAQLRIPIVLKSSSVWYSQIDYHYFGIENESLPTFSPMERFDLHSIIFRTGYIHRFNSKQSLQVLFAPRFMSDLNASFSNSIQLGGVLMYEKIKNENFTWKVGVLYNQEFFGPYIVPVVDLDWSITEKLKFKGLLPVYGAIFVEPSEKFSAGLHFIGLTTTYRIFEPNFENFYVDRRSVDVSLFSKLHLFDNLFLTARAGYSLSKDYGLFAEDDKIDFALPLVNFGDDRTRVNNEFEGSPFVHLRLTYSIPVK